MSGHTPGPWHASEFGRRTKENQADYTRISFGPRTGQFEAVFLTERPVSSLKEVEANAKLAAAAPDLLEALQDFVKAMSQPIPIINTAKAKAAIARAKGEA